MDALFSAADLSSREGYGQFLVAQAAAFLPAEAGLEAGGVHDVLPDWARRRRSQFLVQDLSDLGLAVPDAAAAPAVSGGPALLGWAYVLEGSRLGGNMLRRAVPADMPTAFLSDSYPEAWPTMVAALDQQLTEPVAIGQAIEAARTLFAVFEQSAQAMVDKRITDVA
ncbi:heme oxygenase [Sphingomonas kaistensis]|uniref:Heme oxygenase n=1 Tax=Sphingomonas kaistensis TaxID=298708 RepID=A0A7X6BFT9_9SPHN|nr:biliverdin-producing heme oxygenase [Sphingomonas kaistensis]NJC04371.1 heme oxygenase [Sphingomonas kaistensis]